MNLPAQPLEDVERLPSRTRALRIALGYTAATVALYLLGPVPWATSNTAVLLTLLTATWAAFTFAAMITGPGPAPAPVGPRFITRLVVLGATLNMVTLPVAVLGYTGTSLTDVSFSLADQGSVYLDRYLFLVNDEVSGQRLVAGLARASVSPFVYGGIAIAFYAWRHIGFRVRVFAIASVVTQVAYSYARGTDKEIVDLAIIAAAAVIVGRRPRLSRRMTRAVAAVLIAGVLVTVFVGRREARLGDSLSTCVTAARVCAPSAIDDPVGRAIGSRAYYGYVSGTGYVTQGYFALDLALPLEFPATMGFGSNQAVTRTVARITGLSPPQNTYQDQLLRLGWDSRHSWTSAYTYLANDLSFYLLPVAWLAFGWLMQASFLGATRHRDPIAFVAFSLVFLSIIYTPANVQLGTSLDGSITLIAWLSLWLLRRRQAIRSHRRRVAVAGKGGPTETAASLLPVRG